MISLTPLYRAFERSEAAFGQMLPIRKTCRGIWVPTPVAVIEEALIILRGIGLLGDGAPNGHVVDAGTGDGRIPAVLVQFDPTRSIYGIERDPALYAQTSENLRSLGRAGLLDHDRTHLIEGDYCDLATYEMRGLDVRHTAVVFNYPDGNHARLARFISAHAGRDTKLCLLTHDRTLALDELELRDRQDVSVGTEPAWRLSVYDRPQRQ